MSNQTVFVQFRYCPLCRLNHKKGKKHIRSKRHQDTVANVLAKFLKKVTIAKECLKKPAVKDLTWDQADQNFWCYFCQAEARKHRHNVTAMGECFLEHGGMLEHITRSDHLENTKKFLKENRQDMKRMADFILSSKVYLKYLEDTELACSEFFTQKSQVLKQIASQIRSQTVTRHEIVCDSITEQSLHQQDKKQQPYLSDETRWPRDAGTSHAFNEAGKKTVQAFGEGLTAIDRDNEDDSIGNIYTNALPPWMQPDSDIKAPASVVGPTMEDLERHRKLEKKKQLPAGRVGAKFDRKSGQTETWLPNFGGVWSHRRRTHSAQQFQKRQSQKMEPGLYFSASEYPDQESSSSAPVSSYSFPKIPRRTATITSSGEAPADNSSSAGDSVVKGQPFCGSSLSSCVSNLSQNSDLSQEDFISARQKMLTSAARATNYVPTSTQTISDSADTLTTIRPYVRQRKSDTVTHSGSATFVPIYSSHTPQSVNTNGPERFMSRVWSSGSEKPGPFLPVQNHILTIFSDGQVNGDFIKHQEQRNPKPEGISSVGRRDLDVRSDTSFRLIATPVLNRPVNEFPLKKPSGPDSFDK